ncbi:MAG: 1-deoxy-D-xylulose-5-phosphate reductoisomerase [Ruminococcaceae bacterium]|nr:1-deoxy-D-xylulose-5-phosphate reductoisomerase [Oscillospiraceae bacterium]
MSVKKLSILGSTGSIGVQALSVVEDLNIEITALSAYSNIDLLEKQVKTFKPRFVSVTDEKSADILKTRLKSCDVEVFSGEEGLQRIVEEDDSDTVLNSLVGISGLLPTMAAIKSGKNIALANKETLVAGGKFVMAAAKDGNISILPVDSEHSAIFQCLAGGRKSEVKKIFLTASGGPFFGMSKNELKNVTVEDALRHPNWSMGRKITVDSATMMNKGLELIEAMWLFDVKPDDIEIVVHRQSIVHSMVEFIDGSVIAHLGVPDMRIPIQYALTYPDRLITSVEPLTVERMANLTFEKPDYENFPCLTAAVEAAKTGLTAPCVANAANEVAVKYFLEGKISFVKIGEIVSDTVRNFNHFEVEDINSLLQADSDAREMAKKYI